MKITAEQTEQLYQFTRQHYVEYYDLQTELVDHLANGIENQWRKNPKLTFEEALQQEFKKFGVFGFMTVVEERQQAMYKRYNRIVWIHFKAFFTLPKIAITVLSVLLLKLVLKRILFADELVLTLFIGLLLFFFIGLIIAKRKSNRKLKMSGKKWMLEEVIYTFGSMAGFTYLPLQIFLRIWEHSEHPVMIWVISIIIVIMAVLEYVLLVAIPKKSEVYLGQTYPEKYI
ncbi:hypothetical protein ABGT15_09700 [Flavobacterium enshiense]|uniref:hypothetical protein n=1 Tax=Flavobacterium enshiense TaxID=1341165 RepID=UPI00345C6FC5